MLQKNTFFSYPLTFFGSHCDEVQEDDDDDLLMNKIALNLDTHNLQNLQVGLIIRWHEEDEFETM